MSEQDGHDALWGWFGLSYACWLTMPRVLMHAMPDEWQAQMAKLLREFDDEFDWCDFQTWVSAKRDGKFCQLPYWCSRQSYRHPNKSMIDSLRRKKP
jgi:hypothetical protein